MKRIIGCSLVLWWGSCMGLQALPEVDYLNKAYYQEDRVSLIEALKALETHYGQTLVFTYEDVRNFQVKMTEWKPTIEEALDSLLTDFPLTYICKQNLIIIRKRSLGFSLNRFSPDLYLQTKLDYHPEKTEQTSNTVTRGWYGGKESRRNNRTNHQQATSSHRSCFCLPG